MESHDLRDQLTIKSQKAEAYFFRMGKRHCVFGKHVRPRSKQSKKDDSALPFTGGVAI